MSVKLESQKVAPSRVQIEYYRLLKRANLPLMIKWLESSVPPSPNEQAAQRRRKNHKNIVEVDCLLCENGVCFGIKHWYDLPFGYTAEHCKISVLEDRIQALTEQIQAELGRKTELYSLLRDAGYMSYNERQRIRFEIKRLQDIIQPTTRRISTLEDHILELELSLMPVLVAMNDLKIEVK